ncbi:MAG: YhbY family RNA-binding protein [Fusobacteria bacterium]|nr:YhbY family RNA-binding protein [Fusobacteriota bacterium]
MNSKQRAYLRKLGQTLEPLIRVGKDGIKPTLIVSVNDAFETRELIKVKMLQTVEDEKKSVAEFLITGSECELIHILGGTILLYKPNIKHNDISTYLRGLVKKR